MPPEATRVTPPPKDNRWKLVEAAMRRHGYKSHALIEALHSAQESYGYLEEPILRAVAHGLKVPLSKVYGVATFYSFFSLKPQGKHTCVVCTGTACYIKGAGEIMEAIGKTHGIQSGETTPDGQISLITARCFGSCGLAPAAVFDGEVAGKLNADSTLSRMETWRKNDHS